ncbi:hypothetical protein CCYS_03645 [Corynebacterium cystitidis DSM 20524]|uniref:DUF4143 domain-containing protein n=1 Tax=Corynebacterium cystitidis DSM 20524 TaxID=1121357 RepID=A0A1H9QSI5_9CORY|nr:hypothetical protein CCYS_03645 [Corynebacterium cystitidis DSM 20524]SER62799.1 hypothetical protein SAMN05661109_00636 [Corynebacterium cystitidis DSM 20524]SNV84801.1 AAA+ superfamily ATPase [Corynebacterium cystitidis]
MVIEGPRACGKTRTGMQLSNSMVFFDDPATATIADIDIQQLINGPAPRLLDEWQLYPQLWNIVRREVDFAQGPGRFILTGSAVPDDDIRRHSGAGRFARIRQRTMTWTEKADLDPKLSLQELFDDPTVSVHPAELTLNQVISLLLQPGFPGLITMPTDGANALLDGYIDDVVEIDVHRLAEIRHEPIVLRTLLSSLARNTATEVSIATLRKDMGTTLPTPAPETISHFLGLLERVFVVDKQPALATALRSKAALRKSAKYHLADPSLGARLLGADTDRLQRDPETLGFLFESAVIHDLSVYAQALGGKVSHYRDSNGHEIDAVIDLPNNTWAAIEVKLGGGQITAGNERLQKAIAQIDRPAPTFAAVITGTGPTANLGDSTVTFPLSALTA